MVRVTTVDRTQFSKLVGITPRHVNRLESDGVLVRARNEDGKELRGRYELAANILAYCNYLRSQAKLDDMSESKYIQLRNRKMAADSEQSELKLAIFKNTLHRSDDVEFWVTSMLTAFKSRVLAIPSRIARLLIGQTKFQVIYDIIMTEIELCLRELVAYDPAAFAARSKAFLYEQGVEPSGSNGHKEKDTDEPATDQSGD